MNQEERLLGYVKRLTDELRTTRSRLSELQEERHTPVAVVGMACRYPGDVDGPDALWNLVAEGRDATGPVPEGRAWAAERPHYREPGQTGPRAWRGGFLRDVAGFDAAFFGISPREARAMDPQQRLMLEVTWEALEHAAIDPRTLRGSDTAVYAGANQQAYGPPLHLSPPSAAGHRLTGSAGSVISGRIAYTLGLGGPALSVDTACSSSLVALHLAVRALRTGETGLALAGGVTVMNTPGTIAEFDRQGGLAADGRCKSFSADADGTGLAEGAGMLVLERLTDARRNGHIVHAVIRGSAVNQDGASNGLSAPSGPAQRRVIEAALADARLAPGDVDAVEAHGTGTPLGDPIEASALRDAYAEAHRDGPPLWLGSLKSNIGHTQAAAGVGGVIKMIGALHHDTLPRTLHAERPTAHVDWQDGGMALLARATAWPRTPGRPRRAAISSFGISGTNAHLILEEPPTAQDQPAAAKDGPEHAPSASAGAAASVWLLSARMPEQLGAQAARLAAHLRKRPGLAAADVAHTLAVGRTALEHRAGLVGGDRDDLLWQLDAVARGETHPAVLLGTARGRGTLGYLFSGQGAQRAGMGAESYRAFPAFRAALDAVCAAVDPLLGTSLKDALFAGADRSPLRDTAYAQPALFALQVAQFRLLESLGLRPDVLIGHSVGEIAAVHTAGMLSLPDAARLAVVRGRLMQELPPGGGMTAVRAASADVAPHLAGHEGRVEVAAVNGPASVVLSGDLPALREVEERLRAAGARTRRLDVAHAFHSARMAPAEAGIRALAGELAFGEPDIPVVSSLTGRVDAGEMATPEYWVRQARDTVRFAAAVATARQTHGADRLLELGPGASLASVTSATPGAPPVLALTPPGASEATGIVRAVTRLHTLGTSPRWERLLPGTRVPLPPYAFAREHHWLAEDGSRPGVVITERFSRSDRPWLLGHTVHGRLLVPGTALLELALRAAQSTGHPRIGELVLHTPVELPAEGDLLLRVVAEPGSDAPPRQEASIPAAKAGDPGEPERAAAPEQTPFTVESAVPGKPGSWTAHATGHFTTAPTEPPAGLGAPTGDGAATDEPLDPMPRRADGPAPRKAAAVPLDGFYGRCAENGLAYGPAFRGLGEVRVLDDRLYARAEPPRGTGEERPGALFHPPVLDALLQATLAVEERPAVRMPFAWRDVVLHRAARGSLTAALVRRSGGALSLRVADADGRAVLSAEEVTLRPASQQRGSHSGLPPLRRSGLRPVRSAGADPSTRIAVLGDPTGYGPRLKGRPTYSTVDELVKAVDGRAADTPDVLVVPVPRPGAEQGGRLRRLHELAAAHLAMLARCLTEPRLSATRLVLLTRDATGRQPDLAGAALRGLWRSAGTEHPGRVACVDTDGGAPSAEHLLDALLSGPAIASRAIGSAHDGPHRDGRSGEGHHADVVLRDGDVFETVLEPLAADDAAQSAPAPAAATAAFDQSRTVLVTGGTGALGRSLARHLVHAHGVRHLVLVSRSGAEAPGVHRLLDELAAAGAEAAAVVCDVSDPAAVDALVTGIEAGPHPLGAVVHTAAVLDDATVTRMTAAQLHAVLRPKTDAAWHLHERTRDLPLTRFVLYGSAAARLGTAGQANYAAANAGLDALAEHRAALGLPALAIAWGWWDGDGMTSRLTATDALRLRALGLAPLSPEEGLALFDAALRTQVPAVTAARFEHRAAPAGPPAPVTPVAPAASATGGADGSAAPGTPSADHLTELVRGHAAAVLGHTDVSRVGVDEELALLGLDSLGSVDLRNSLRTATGCDLPLSAFLAGATPVVLAHRLHALLSERATPDADR